MSNLIAINLTAVVHGCQLAHKHFKAQLKDHPDRQFCIVNTSSYSAVLYTAAIPVYSTTKAAVS
jgi:15-hydroxyprostaglandin dehydrogenase (NAD)